MSQQLGINPWLKMWVDPRRSIQAIVDYNPKFKFPLLSFIYGFPMMLHFMQTISAAESLSLPVIVVLSLALAPFIGMLGISIISGLLLWTGKWLGGKGSYLSIRAAVSWSNVPNIVNILMWLLLVVTFGSELFLSAFAGAPFVGRELGIVGFAFFIQGVVSIWSFVILLQGLGQVQGFSAWKGLLNVILPFLLITVFMWLVLIVFWHPMPMQQ